MQDGQKIFDIHLDLCKFLKTQNRANVLMIFLLEAFRKYGVIPTKCPIPKNHYFIRNMTFNGLDVPFTQYFFKDVQLLGQISVDTKEGKDVKRVLYSEALFILRNN